MQKRRGQFTQTGLHGRQQTHVPQSATDHVVARRGPSQRTPLLQFVDQAICRRYWQSCAMSHFGESEAAMPTVECSQQG